MTRDLQRLMEWMSICIEDRRDAASGARTAAAAALYPFDRVAAGGVVRPNDRMTALERVDVYNGGYFTRLKEVLESDFKALLHALDERQWTDLALGYCFHHPSRHQNLNRFNRHLATYIAEHTDLPGKAFLAELAALEILMTEAFDAPESTPLDVATLQHLTPEEWAAYVFTPNPSLRLLATRFPVNRYLQAVYDGEDPARPAPEDAWVAVFRKDYKVWRQDLPAPMFAVLRSLAAGQPLGAALEAGGEHGEDFQRWFGSWSADGLFVQA